MTIRFHWWGLTLRLWTFSEQQSGNSLKTFTRLHLPISNLITQVGLISSTGNEAALWSDRESWRKNTGETRRRQITSLESQIGIEWSLELVVKYWQKMKTIRNRRGRLLQILTCLAQLRQKGEPKTANSVLDHENKVFGCGNLFEVEIKRWKDAWP